MELAPTKTQTLSTLDMVRMGYEHKQQVAVQAESEKVGVLRGGSAGVWVDNQKRFAGHCPAIAYLRYRGITLPDATPDLARQLMWDMGHTNEDSWLQLLKSSWPGRILVEEEIPVALEVESEGRKVRVTGRPDLVLCAKDGTPVRGLELKAIASMWTARHVVVRKQPKIAHVCQAAFYMLAFESRYSAIPYEIWYTSRTAFEVAADFHQKDYPRYGEPGSENFDYQFRHVDYEPDPYDENVRIETKHTIDEAQFQALLALGGVELEASVWRYKPFVQGYGLSWGEEDDFLYTQDLCIAGAEKIRTVITRAGILKYYGAVASLDKLPKEPVALKVHGEKESHRFSKLCALDTGSCKGSNLCCRHKDWQGKPIDEWVRAVQVMSTGVNSQSTEAGE